MYAERSDSTAAAAPDMKSIKPKTSQKASDEQNEIRKQYSVDEILDKVKTSILCPVLHFYLALSCLPRTALLQLHGIMNKVLRVKRYQKGAIALFYYEVLL